MSIPKIIHYCWFGGKPLPKEAQRCIASWRKFCPDYKIVEWNESNYDVNKNFYTKTTYANKQWAFLADYVRLDVVESEGGIYLDTDVELLRPLDKLLQNECYLGMEQPGLVNTGLGFGAVKHNPFIKKNKEFYENKKNFLDKNGVFRKKICVKITSDLLRGQGLTKKQEIQIIDGATIYPVDYFCPKKMGTNRITVTKNTYSIHHYDASWKSNNKLIRKISYYLILPKQFIRKLYEKIKHKGLLKTFGFVATNIATSIVSIVMALPLWLLTTKKIIVFYSLPDYSDNAKYLYEAYIKSKKYSDYKFIWLVEDPKTVIIQNQQTKVIKAKAKYANYFKLKAQYYINRARVVYFTHSPAYPKLRKSQIICNLWHGCGYKDSNRRGKKDYMHFDYALVPGREFIEAKAKFWNCDTRKVVPIGYPRYDLLSADCEKAKEYINNLTGNNKVILWMPTFRKSNLAYFPEQEMGKKFDFPIFNNVAEVEKMNRYCQEKKVTILIKRHPMQIEYSIEKENYSNIKFITNNILKEKNIELYSLLKYTDCLITDYSSIAVDYLLLNKPIAYTLDDFEQYSATRGFVFDEPKRFMPGDFIYDVNDFKRFIANVADGIDDHATDRNKMKKVMQNPTSDYCNRIIEFIETKERER